VDNPVDGPTEPLINPPGQLLPKDMARNGEKVQQLNFDVSVVSRVGGP
jgi:hypothetical protein